ncbi:MAG: hypothetical protein ACM3TN_19365 [Alphaproteobacteria bacterium]
MTELKSEIVELREAIHALARVIRLIPEIYVARKDKAECLAAQVSSDLIEEVLSKTSHERDHFFNNQKRIKNGDA